MRRCLALAVLLFVVLLPMPAALADSPAPHVPEGVEYLPDLVYARIGTRDLHLDLARPKEIPAGAKLPAAVHIHGGGWSGGDYHTAAILGLAQHGYVAVTVEYRLSGEAKWPAQIDDCKGAIRWLRANAAKYALDPDRIGVWGESAGGHLSSLVATSGDVKALAGTENPGYSDKVACCIDLFGPISFDPSAWSPALVSRPNNPLEMLFGKPLAQAPDLAREASPLTYLTKNCPPVLILHGTKDPIVPFSQSQLFYDALKKAGVETTFIPLEGAGHGGPEFMQPAILAKMVDFLDTHLKRP